MRIPSLSFIAAISLATSPTPTASAPAPGPPPLLPRSQVCANSPSTVAGTLFDRRTLPHNPAPAPRAPTLTVWCAPGSRTYISVTLTAQVAGPAVENLLNSAYQFSQSYIELMGDGVVPAAGMGHIPVDGYRLTFANANNHQLTWGVYGAAVVALTSFMQTYGFGPAVFSVVDGANQVATGVVAAVLGG